MADESGGITLRIDADTARYIAEISKAAEKTKSLADPTKEIGDGWNRVGDSVKQTADRLIGFSIPMTATAAAAAGISLIFEEWNRKLQTGKDALESIQRTQAAMASVGLSGQIAQSTMISMRGAAPGMSDEEITGLVQGVKKEYPGASAGQLTGIGARANIARQAGMNPIEWGTIFAGLESTGVEGPADKSTFALQHIRDEQLRNIAVGTSMLHPEDADFVMRMASKISAIPGRKARAMPMGILENAINQATIYGNRVSEAFASGVGLNGPQIEMQKNMMKDIGNMPEIGTGKAEIGAAEKLATPAGAAEEATKQATQHAIGVKEAGYGEAGAERAMMLARYKKVGAEYNRSGEGFMSRYMIRASIALESARGGRDAAAKLAYAEAGGGMGYEAYLGRYETLAADGKVSGQEVEIQILRELAEDNRRKRLALDAHNEGEPQ
jgi:hypothetical protein